MHRALVYARGSRGSQRRMNHSTYNMRHGRTSIGHARHRRDARHRRVCVLAAPARVPCWAVVPAPVDCAKANPIDIVARGSRGAHAVVSEQPNSAAAAAQVIPGRSREELYTALDEEVPLRTDLKLAPDRYCEY